LNRDRLPEIASYITRNPDSYVFSSLTASVDGEMRFEPLAEGLHSDRVGLLRISMDSRFVINDGQHRRAAIDLAMKEYQEALQADPDFAPAHTALGWIQLNKGRSHDALESFSRALKVSPEDASAYYGVAQIYEAMGKHQMAEEHFRQALKFETNPEKKSAIMNHLVQHGRTMD